MTWRRYIGNNITYMAIQTLSDLVVVGIIIVALFVVAPYASLAVMAVLVPIGGGFTCFSAVCR